MKKTLFAIGGAFVAGMIVSAGISVVFAYRWIDRATNDAHRHGAVMLMQRAHDANMIRSGHVEGYLAIAERSFLADLPSVVWYCQDEGWKKSAIWAVQEYYRDNKIEVPASISAEVNSIPPRIEGRRFSQVAAKQ